MIRQVLLAIVALAALVYSLNYALSLPVVYESYSRGECVRVDDPEGKYSCENMPTKYDHVWVE